MPTLLFRYASSRTYRPPEIFTSVKFAKSATANSPVTFRPPEIFAEPLTSKFANGVIVPIPTLPSESSTKKSVEPTSRSPIISRAALGVSVPMPTLSLTYNPPVTFRSVRLVKSPTVNSPVIFTPPEKFAEPFTSSVAKGVVVPIPTLPVK